MVGVPKFQDCIATMKIGDTLYSGFPPKLCKPTNLNVKKDIVTLPDSAFTTMSSDASQAVKNTFMPVEAKYRFPV